MLKLIFCSLVQSAFLAAGQVFLKFSLEKLEQFAWTWTFFRSFLTNWWLLASGLSMVAASVIWFYILKHYDLSLAYPLISISYIFGTLAAVCIFHETVPLTRWIGVLFIMIGVAFLTKPA
ncbi:MAG: EamA family transporter [Tannerella sp.]|jgi:undecaprenyl phosphate-alpha-L-ara4N flippase subunit ArnE|nr:EamA family transporter [Tannerella sp.]